MLIIQFIVHVNFKRKNEENHLYFKISYFYHKMSYDYPEKERNGRYFHCAGVIRQFFNLINKYVLSINQLAKNSMLRYVFAF